MFQFKSPKTEHNDELKDVLSYFKDKGEGKRAFRREGVNSTPQKTIHKKNREKGVYEELSLDDETWNRVQEYKGNMELYHDLLDELKESLQPLTDNSDKYVLTQRLICPYTGRIVTERGLYVPGANFKEVTESFDYKDDEGETQYTRKYSVVRIGHVSYPTANVRELGDIYHPTAIETMRDALSYSKSLSEFDVPTPIEARVKGDNTESFIVVEDTIEDVKVYYPHTESFERKKVYFSLSSGRYYKYKSKRIPLPTPDIYNFQEKVDERMSVGKWAYYYE